MLFGLRIDIHKKLIVAGLFTLHIFEHLSSNFQCTIINIPLIPSEILTDICQRNLGDL